MIFYVLTDVAEKYLSNQGWAKHQQTLEKASGDVCLSVHYKRLSRKMIAELRPWAICHSGSGTSYDEYDVLEWPRYRRAVDEYAGAQIGFCGGHQILAVFYGSRIAPMRPLRPDEPDLSDYCPGAFKEWGMYPVRIVGTDPLFKGCAKTIRVQEFHSWEVKRLGRDLRLLASSGDCRVQAFCHRHRPLYGVQFHPERSSERYPDGFRVLGNFFQIAREHWKAQSK